MFNNFFYTFILPFESSLFSCLYCRYASLYCSHKMTGTAGCFISRTMTSRYAAHYALPVNHLFLELSIKQKSDLRFLSHSPHSVKVLEILRNTLLKDTLTYSTCEAAVPASQQIDVCPHNSSMCC